eukprot:GEMP01050021.1.p1 GENE.GEMP01050021.1~~GEMP01050021.1.p1  ORF type:complete len:111 (+),score=26.49 GEMP01050021.1:172-504(+)
MEGKDLPATGTPRPQFNMWHIGQGFEGTAADWTEYVVLLTGMISLIFYLWQRNISPLPEFDYGLREGEDDEADEGEDEKHENETTLLDKEEKQGNETTIADNTTETKKAK